MQPITVTQSNWQQPVWDDEPTLLRVRQELNNLPPLIPYEEIPALYKKLEKVWLRQAIIFQAGDCAERIKQACVDYIHPRLKFLTEMSEELAGIMDKPVISVGRIAGQYAKPRSQHNEQCAGLTIPVWRGDCVNQPEATLTARRNDPERMLLSYQAAARTLAVMRAYRYAVNASIKPIWTSHEALLLDYEHAQLRSGPTGAGYLASTHWPWMGIRTLDLQGPHIALLEQIVNPVACKVDATVTPDTIATLCQRLNPQRIPGRLTFIARFGYQKIHLLAPLIDAALKTDIPVLWMCDPMHGNTQKTPLGNKRRELAHMMKEIAGFQRQLAERDACCAGIHLEATPEKTTECFGGGYQPTEHELQRIVCDPRLNASQTQVLLHHWKKVQETL